MHFVGADALSVVIKALVYFQALNKKEHKGCDSPDPDCDPYMSSMNFEEKYNRMNEDYQRVLQQNQLRVGIKLGWHWPVSRWVVSHIKENQLHTSGSQN